MKKIFDQQIIQCFAGNGAYCVEASAIRCGHDISVAVCGGTTHHVGAVSLAQYEPERDSATVSTVTVFSHRDDVISARYAKELSRALKCTVSVSAGLHIDGASQTGIQSLCESAELCLRHLMELLKEKCK